MNAACNDVPTDFTLLVKKMTPTINYLISQELKGINFNSSNVCYELEDVFQDCLIHLDTARKKYDPSRGMKFNTFAIMLLKSRLGNFRGKVLRSLKNPVYSMSEINNGFAIVGLEDNSGEINSNMPSVYKKCVEDLRRSEEALNEIIDAKRIQEKLTNERRIVFSEYYILGKTFKEINEDTDIKYHVIRRNMKYLEPIYNTLIKGDTPCLQ